MENARAQSKLALYLPFAAMLILIWSLYLTTFKWWWYEWTYQNSYYAHALFVPFFVAVMIWRNRERLARVRWQPAWSGLYLLIPGLGLLLMAERFGIVTMQSISFVLVLVGGALLLLGWSKTRRLLFPLLFVVMMMPLVPDQLINGIAFPIQLTSARMATWLLNAISLHAVREGTQIQLEHYRLDVEIPCSGFKTLISLLTFAAAFAYLVEGAAWKRWTLFCTTAPLSLVINALRITMIAIVGELISTEAAATFHDYSGLIVLILAYLFMFNFARLLQCDRFLGMPLNAVEERRDREMRMQESPAGPPEPSMWQTLLRWRPTRSQLRRAMRYMLVLDLVLLTALGARGLVVKRRLPHPAIARFQVPEQFRVGGVTYSLHRDRQTDRLSPSIEAELNPLRIINRDYYGSDGSQIQFFLTAGNGRKVFHDPHTCSIAIDAILTDQRTVDIPTSHGTLRLQESKFHHIGQSDEFEMMYCYFVEGKLVPRTQQADLTMFWQMLSGDSGQPSYFMRVFQEAPGIDAAKRRQLINFITGMYDQIGPVLTLQQPGLPDAPPNREEGNSGQ